MMTKKEIMNSKYNLDEESDELPWKFTFQIFFVERSFRLSARTLFEYNEWVRIFKVVDQMNKIGCSMLK